MNIPKDMIVNPVKHRYAGHGWAVVATYPENWASVVSIGKGEVGRQFFSVWTKLLKADPTYFSPMPPEMLGTINGIRNDLQSGKKIIKDTLLVAV